MRINKKGINSFESYLSPIVANMPPHSKGDE